MDAVSYALAEVCDRIPPQVLKLVFRPEARTLRHESRDVEYAIRDRVIEGRVRRTVNAVGATEIDIPLAGLGRTDINRYMYTYKIPMTLTGGREISSAIALTHGINAASGYGSATSSNNPANMIETAAMRVMTSHEPVAVNQTSNVSIIAMNTILVEDYTPISATSFLRCLLTSDKDYSHIKPAYYGKFAELVVLAVKSYIYNVYDVELGMGKIVGGVELSEIRNVVDRYSNADEEYLDYVENTWRKVVSQNDPKRKQRQIKMLSGN